MARVAKPNGSVKAPASYTTNESANVPRRQGVYIGIVKDNKDPQNMGRLQVYIPDFGGDPEAESSWHSASYASPFGGTTSIFDQGKNVEEYSDTIKSYGFWAVPPDLDAQVLVTFIAGKGAPCYWFACIFQTGTQVSIPGLPVGKTHKGDNIPVAPKNRKDLDPDITKYVAHEPAYTALRTQGLENDPLRGTTTSGAMREAPSKVIGLLTPGQHQFVLDDGDKDGNNRLIRLRTTNGTQLLLDDVAGHVYLISKNGESWVELSADGRIHLYGSKDINIRSQENINLYADNNVNIEAGLNINMKANAGSFQVSAGNEVSMLAVTNTKISSGETSNILSGVGHYETAGVIHMNGPVADAANEIPMYNLAVNQGVKESICNVVPEHEPWAGHSGMINPIGTGNMQMQKDPAPSQDQPRKPKANENPAPVVPTPNKDEAVPIEKVEVSEKMISVIKQQNGYTPVNTADAAGESGGYGSVIVPEKPKPPYTGATGFDLNLPPGKGSVLLSANAFTDFNNKLKAAEDAAKNGLNGAMDKISPSNSVVAGGVSVGSGSSEDIAKMLSQGISPDKAQDMLFNDLARNQRDVRSMLSGAGVTSVPPNVFDGLISLQNQTGDASMAFVNGQKVDLTPLYKAGAWDQAASFIAADERDRNRRILEASIIANNNYGPEVNEQQVITKGMARVNELIAKGRLNQQTATGATNQQTIAAATNYFNETGNPVAGSTYEFNNQVSKNTTNGNLANIAKQGFTGPWPY